MKIFDLTFFGVFLVFRVFFMGCEAFFDEMGVF